MAQGEAIRISEAANGGAAPEIARRTWERLAPLVLDIERAVQAINTGDGEADQLGSDLELLAKAGEALRHRLTFTVELMNNDRIDEVRLGRLRHDLRTPLNALKGYCELALDDVAGRADLTRQLSQIHELIEVFGKGVDEHMALDEEEDAESAPASEGEPAAAQSGRVLLVEDHDESRAVVARFLAKDGHQVLEAADGACALRLLGSEAVDVVLLDHHLPDLEGNEILTRMKADPRLSAIPVIMISAGDEARQIGTSLKLGADDYVAKPIDRVLLRARLAACLDRKRLKERDNMFWLNSLKTVMDLAVDGIVILTAGGIVEAANPIACGIFATTAQRFAGQPFGPYFGAGANWTPAEWPDARSSDAVAVGLREATGHRATGARFPLEIAIRSISNADQPRQVAICRDISVRRAEEERMAFLARHDPITELPNRTMFIDWVNDLLGAPESSGTVMLMAVSGLREGADAGHFQSSGVLRSIAGQLRRAAPDNAKLASLGNSQFAVMITPALTAEAAERAGDRLLSAVPRVVSIDGADVDVETWMGVTVVPEHGDNPSRILRNLDLAIERARHEGDRKLCSFNNDMWRSYRARRAQERDLAEALELGQLEVHFQPKVRMSDRRVIGGEALVRWKHATHGYVPPSEFIPIAETTGLIVPLGQFVIEETVRRLSSWSAMGLATVPIALNVSPVQFRRADLVRIVRDAAAARGVPCSMLEIEITESLLVQDRRSVSRVLLELRDMGAHIAIDDFGTGHSSLSYLAELPIDTLKVDQSFVRNLTQSGQNREIARTIVQLARSLDLETVAEGVETAAQADFLHAIGCTYGQGYLFAKPLLPDMFARLFGKPLPVPEKV